MSMATYRRAATGQIYPAGMNYLSDLIIRPGIEKTFGPLLLYRGKGGRGWAHRWWNASLIMMAHEVETVADGVKLFDGPNFSQLCAPPKRVNKLPLYAFLQRLADNPGVTRQIPQFTDYIRSLEVGETILQRVDRYSERPGCAEWRIYRGEPAGPPKERGWKPTTAQMFYPYMAHDAKKPDEGAALAKLVSDAVPKTLPEEIRADACQDIIVALLTGEINVQQVRERAESYVRRVWRDFGEFKNGTMVTSTDVKIGDGSSTLLDLF